MLLLDLEDLLLERPCSKENAANYRRSLRLFGQFLGRAAKRGDLRETVVNRWLAEVSKQRTEHTVRGHKAAITVVWNWLAEQGIVPCYDSRRLRKIKLTHPVPNPWTLEQVRQLLKACDTLPGRMKNGIYASDLMRAWIMVGYETALRPGDLRRLRPSSLVGNKLVVRQNKTGNPVECLLSQETLRALQPLVIKEASTVFPASRNTVRRWELRLYAHAQRYGFGRHVGQGIGTLRKTNATEVCRLHGIEAAARSLGHVSGTTIAMRHYVAPSALGDTPTPPRLCNGQTKRHADREGASNRDRAG